MPSDFFLGQTAAEWAHPLPDWGKKAWMACHFSPYGVGLSNLPTHMPSGSMLILNDRTPVCGHDPDLIANQLAELAEKFECSRILLDFQRPEEAQTYDIAKAILQAAACPVGISHWYGAELDCAVCLPPLPLHMPLHSYIAPWLGRDIWLELAPESAQYIVTESGCQVAPCHATGRFPHFDEALFCRYRIDIGEEKLIFTLCRTQEDALALRNANAIECFVGLYQDFSHPDAQATAFAQWDKRS